nr:integrase, catalytic region, zinc finger, CCHC-type, peptidase aspartic, catalytic [Tanacetum cinerariifolium]
YSAATRIFWGCYKQSTQNFIKYKKPSHSSRRKGCCLECLGSTEQWSGKQCKGTCATGNGGAQNRVGNINSGQARQIKCYNYNDNIVDEDVDELHVQDLALNVDNVFQADKCDAFNHDVDKAPTAQTMFMANLSSTDPVCDKYCPSYDSNILSENLKKPVKGELHQRLSLKGKGALNKQRNVILPRHHNIHQRSGSPLNLAKDDLSLGNLKFVPKGKINEVFGMKILEELITNNIRNTPYYNAYLEMVAKNKRRIAAAKEGGKKKTTPKADKLVKPTPAKQAKPATAKQPKSTPVKEELTKPTPL